MPYKIVLLDIRPAATLSALLRIWEGAVRATHDFLAESDIEQLLPLVEQGLKEVPKLAVVRDEAGDGAGAELGFIGLDDDGGKKIAMLFIDPARHGQGLGRRLVEFAVRRMGATLVDVNEQNTQGVGFYHRLGIERFARSPLDGQGRPFPVLHLRLAK
ncbi:MAG: GNAT family N-acetyltransferase [Deltaproteobacteria bacterium]|jgi:putative acetyltransferase|nr:GNAT family N-acetyltransferase [Deltaproteobacteria bacterium]